MSSTDSAERIRSRRAAANGCVFSGRLRRVDKSATSPCGDAEGEAEAEAEQGEPEQGEPERWTPLRS